MELASAARAALEDVEEPRKVDVPGPAAASGLRFVGAWRTDNVLVTSTTTKNEAVTIARTIEATPAYLRVALGDSLRVIPGFTVYALSQRSDAKAVIDVHPSTDALTREHWTKFGAYWIGNQPQYLTYHTSPAWRLEATASQQIAFDLRERFGVAGDRAAWAAAGFEKRLAWDLVGTRITFSRRISEYAEQDVPWATWGDLTDGDWYRRARGVLAGYGPVDLAELFGKPLNLLTLPDEVVANAIAAYYLEGRPDECGAFLFALGQGENVDDALHKASGLDIVALRLRLLRWLDERNP